ncbi:MAG: hypothetical protein EAZ90_03680 [Oscillatoriales cyanobacterium]|nr:MAG: hypothetical protein EAZ94_19155 [Oscillatoriales cyanobacterium]TAE21996.1 MAG: hypothetical protein EAZ93_19140 [Oscillatoriales cyanobacterium]TAE45289.1 MAG: hypothetical protein EAZ90_03680 [Oscillatoriales cyanobacterium]TAE54105.1 MAG: hypothetical protein EAZ88_09955 [Oscillatoriales cyanobacterium]TAE72376.1 MAG: hypothetical protein EAZ86_01045 [Oscillatoriales cyanobacterium]
MVFLNLPSAEATGIPAHLEKATAGHSSVPLDPQDQLSEDVAIGLTFSMFCLLESITFAS